MEVGKAVYAILAGNGSLTAVVPASRIFPIEMEQAESLPAVAYQVISDPAINTKSGMMGAQARVQVNAYSDSYQQCIVVALLVRAALADKAAGTYGGVKVQTIKYDSGQDFTDSAGFDGVYHRSLDFIIHYNYG